MHGTAKRNEGRTRIRNLDSDAATLEQLSIASEGSLEALDVGKLGIGEALWPVLLTVLNDTHAQDIAVAKEVGDTVDGRIIRQVAEMGRERRFVGKLLGQIVSNGVIACKRQGSVSMPCSDISCRPSNTQ